MSAKIIDGKAMAMEIRQEIKKQVEELAQKNIKPGLAVVLVGNDPASQIYVRGKEKACSEVGIASETIRLPEDTSESELLNLISKLNSRQDIHGILVQLPLPKHIDSDKIIRSIAPEKDVDGFHPINVGKLALGLPGVKPCTPYGCLKMLKKYEIAIEGKKAVVIGRSNIVGKPVALMLLQENATVSICHSRTKDLSEYTKEADILIAAAGKPFLIKTDMVKPGAAVIDVGQNKLPDGQLVGDVDFPGVSQVAGWITPVPGGVGPMTITMLLYNTLESVKRLC
jgi:methylenetetrahydrofolate dehydrogenase (NADP+)/methenyltetrahydrofolate cyclohydrolase